MKDLTKEEIIELWFTMIDSHKVKNLYLPYGKYRLELIVNNEIVSYMTMYCDIYPTEITTARLELSWLDSFEIDISIAHKMRESFYHRKNFYDDKISEIKNLL